MAGVGGVYEECRRAGGGERRRDLAADMAGLAHAGDDDAAACVADRFDGGDERGAEAIAHGGRQGGDAVALGVERAQRRGDVRACGRLRRAGIGCTCFRTRRQ